MEFNELISDGLGPIFQRHNLHVAEQFKNYVKFKSDRVELVLSHDAREKSNSLEVGTNKGFLYPIDSDIIKEVFNTNIKVSNVTAEIFVHNLAIFFENEGRALLKGDSLTLKAIEQYVYKDSKEYTRQVVDKQNLDAANKAWKAGNYKEFIKYLDKTDKQKLPSSYKLKYKMAYQKLQAKQ